MIDPEAHVAVLGATSAIGAGVVRALGGSGHRAVSAVPGDGPDPAGAAALDEFFARMRPTHVIIASVRAGGIRANERAPADLMADNLIADTHAIVAAHRHGVRKLLYLASSCAYPRDCRQPMRIDDLLTGPLEPTSAAYAMAKLAGMSLCRAFRQQHGDDFVAAIAADGYGPGDDFSDDGAHVVAALIRRIHEARERGAPTVTVWGTGRARRDFLFVDDLAAACLFLLARYSSEAPINVGAGADVSIAELADVIREVVGFRGTLEFNTTKPDGAPRKTLDAAPLRALGCAPTTGLRAGVAATYEWFLAHETAATGARA